LSNQDGTKRDLGALKVISSTSSPPSSSSSGSSAAVPTEETKASPWIDNLHGKFKAKLREVSTRTRQSADGKTTTTFKLALVEVSYDPEVVQRLSPGQLLAIPNVRNLASPQTYSVLEIADVTPMHYSMLTLTTSQPGALRGEFMGMIDKEWRRSSKSNWIEILASPTGYIVDLSGGSLNFERKYSPLLVGSEVKLLSEEAVKQFVCFVPKNPGMIDVHCIGHLLSTVEERVPFTIDYTQLINYHVGVFCHTGGGKSYLTSMILRKALQADPDLKAVIFDVSSEYGIHLLDQLVLLESRIILPQDVPKESEATPSKKAEQYYKKHVVPESLERSKPAIEALIARLFEEDKCKSLYLPPRYVSDVQKFRTYAGFLESIALTAGEKFNANQQASLYVIDQVRDFLKRKNKRDEEIIDKDFLSTIRSIKEYLQSSGVKPSSTISGIINALEQRLQEDIPEPEELGYSLESMVHELLDGAPSSPRLFIINEEVERARTITAQLIERVFKERRNTFNLHPRILFVFDEAQEFAPSDSYSYKSQDGTGESSKAVERLLRHGRKYHLHGWISTQRLAHLNTSALHQIHSYFVGTLPRPYDRQLVGDTFAIDDTLLERTLNFAPGDWLLASFRATKTQNVPVFFHAINNEECILPTK
jgi:DNA helicase HerA-like ATPase